MKMLTGAQEQTILRSNHICVKSPVGSSDRVFTLNWFRMSRRTAVLTSALLDVFFIFSTKVLLPNPNPARVGLHSCLLRLCFTLLTYWLQWPTHRVMLISVLYMLVISIQCQWKLNQLLCSDCLSNDQFPHVDLNFVYMLLVHFLLS